MPNIDGQQRSQAQPRKLKRPLQSDVEPILKKPKVVHAAEPVNRPLKNAVKPRVTISTAKVLKRPPMKQVYPKDVLRRRRRAEPEHELFLDYKEDIEAYRQALRGEGDVALSDANDQLTKALSEISLRDKNVTENTENQRKIVLEPLWDEKVETSFARSGEEVTEIIAIGKRVEEFQAMVLKKQAELKALWNDWDKIQKEIFELGEDVLGEEGAGDPQDEVKRGYGAHVAAWDSELQQQVKEIEKEVVKAGKEAVEELAAAEKETDAKLKKQQASLFSRLFAED